MVSQKIFKANKIRSMPFVCEMMFFKISTDLMPCYWIMTINRINFSVAELRILSIKK
jgi:hypothetical protein